jgi:hypothetical protein
MSGFIHWLAWRVCRVQQGLRDAVADLRRLAEGSAMHRRTPDVVANLAVGLMHFLDFAREVGAVTEGQSERVWSQAWSALGKAAARQAAHQAASEPAARFLELVGSAVSSGNAHLSSVDGTAPADAEAWGWRQKAVGAGAYARDDWQAQGERVGWVEGDSVYLDPDASYKAAQAMAPGGDGIVVSAQTLRKRLHERGLLIREGKRDELTVRRVLSGSTRRVLLLKPGCLITGEPARPAIPATDHVPDPDSEGFLAGALAGFDPAPSETRHPNPPSEPAGAPENAGDGDSGGNGGLSADETSGGISDRRWNEDDDTQAHRMGAAAEAWAGQTVMDTGDDDNPFPPSATYPRLSRDGLVT